MVYLTFKKEKWGEQEMKKCKLLLILTLLISVFSITNVSAIDTPSTGKIVGRYVYGEEKIVDATVALYKVGDVNVADNSYDYELLESFKSEIVDYSKLSTEQLENHTKKLYSIISGEGINPITQVKTDQNGEFNFDNLAAGLYLIKVEDMPAGDDLYRSLPTLIFLPEIADVGSFNYNVSVNMKIEKINNKDNSGDDNNNNNDNINNGQNQNGGSNVNAPNTYDAIVMYVALFIVSAVLLAVLICYIYVYYKKRGRNEKDEQKK